MKIPTTHRLSERLFIATFPVNRLKTSRLLNMTIQIATQNYEKWLGSQVKIVQSDLDYKHALLAELFPFFRGTYYRWAQLWRTLCPELASGPVVLAVGDLHVENFGTWRDADGRLCWGINDFDEADDLAYTHDLVRLATSARFARQAGGLEIKLKAACTAILTGYRETLVAGGNPFVLEEQHPELRLLAMSADREPKPFWKKLTKLLADSKPSIPPAAGAALLRDLPAANLRPEIRARPKIGVGSLGKPRFVAIVQWAGGWIARETKASSMPSTAWVAGEDRPCRAGVLAASAIRSPDPFYRAGADWVTRRLAPRCSRIELESLSNSDDLEHLFGAMGAETANIHLATEGAAAQILADLDARPVGWLTDAVRAMAEAMTADWNEWNTTAKV
jgi:hypothetical protein